MYEPDMIGAIKIKDGLFIGDELASQVSTSYPRDSLLGKENQTIERLIISNNKGIHIY